VEQNSHWKIWIDTGGTFTDCIALDNAGNMKRLKVLSSSILRVKVTQISASILRIDLPFHASRNFLNGFLLSVSNHHRKIKNYNCETCEIEIDKPFPKVTSGFAEISTEEEVPVFAARLLTETSLSESFPAIEMKLGSTRGTNALLERKGARTAFLVTKGFRDLLRIGNQQRPDLFVLNIIKENPLYAIDIEVDERIAFDGNVLRVLSDHEVKRITSTLKKNKIDSVAVALMNSYKNPSNENKLGHALQGEGFNYVSLSHQLSSQIKILPRAETAVVNAYLEPIIHQYVSKIRSGLSSSSIQIMSSAGGLLSATDFKPKDSLLSGPAGGVIGALSKGKQSNIHQLITFDMGGTSTDVSLCNGRPDYRFDCTVGKLNIFSPSLAIETIAAGGGSICEYDGFKFSVGPHSAGASPGPACYGAGGPLTITDVNLLLGRLDEENFSIPLYVNKSEETLNAILEKIKKRGGKKPKAEEVLHSFIGIANEKMAEAIRKVSIQHGYDPNDYALFCFGGAGGQHACALADMLTMDRVVVPYDAGLLSAYGIGQAKTEMVKEKLILRKLPSVLDYLRSAFNELHDEALRSVTDPKQYDVTERLIFLRLSGQETSLEIQYVDSESLVKSFIEKYRKVYGHWMESRDIEVESIRIVLVEKEEGKLLQKASPKKYIPQLTKSKKIFFTETWKTSPVFVWEDLNAGAVLEGPCLLISKNSTLLIEKGWLLNLDENQNAILHHLKKNKARVIETKEAQLELFTNRFTSIAQDMGALLQRTSFSVNVKERLDFSCALLDAQGNLIVNAPHIPVHLGSMGVCVREVMKVIDMKEGDVIITNHPAFGGSHLPDITLIKPVFVKKKLIGFVANRAHHAEVGGKKPGSMPADARCLEEEGVVIKPTHLLKKGKAQWSIIRNLLTALPYPSRSVEENIADLNGALASLQHGDQALKKLCVDHGAGEVQLYMNELKKYSAKLMSVKIKELPLKQLRAIEFLDDGARLKVAISKKSNRLVIDFTGTSAVRPGNMNATKAIVTSVVLYVLRLVVNTPVPLNEGLMKHVKLILPTSLLNPTFSADNKKSPAVVGGNTEISQRLTDTLLKAFGLAACSQGTMNNFLFGNTKFGYYETICGGVGASFGFNGADAVHQHMTNTRITDPEILELRYPVRLEKFMIRKGSGGNGKWKGGDGIEREFYFNESLDINILSQHRQQKPFGINGGLPGKVGEQFLIRANGKREKLKGVDGATVLTGDRIVIKTPGGGGFGKKKTTNK
jgi:5-oxoprolinase (ATP-hydrolysing)